MGRKLNTKLSYIGPIFPDLYLLPDSWLSFSFVGSGIMEEAIDRKEMNEDYMLSLFPTSLFPGYFYLE